jgi:zinc/manganese transport system permease protein
VRALGILFMVLLGLTTAVAIHVLGALLVLSLLVTPAAAAARIASSPPVVAGLSVAFAVTAMVGGILLALGSAVPISPYVTTVSFLLYLVCRLAGGRGRAGSRRLHWSR